MKRLGVIGGLGPMATAYFYRTIVTMTDARHDQEHIETIIYSRPVIPDRSAYILGKSRQSPFDAILETGKALAAMAANFIVMPCVTAHYFYDDLSRELRTPFIHIVQETTKVLKSYGIKSAGIMATDGTIKSSLFQSTLEKEGITSIVPSADSQRLTMDLIYEVKSGKRANLSVFEKISSELRTAGAEIIILGCTELSLIQRSVGYIDPLEVLAASAILLCGARLKKEYESMLDLRRQLC